MLAIMFCYFFLPGIQRMRRPGGAVAAQKTQEKFRDKHRYKSGLNPFRCRGLQNFKKLMADAEHLHGKPFCIRVLPRHGNQESAQAAVPATADERQI